MRMIKAATRMGMLVAYTVCTSQMLTIIAEYMDKVSGGKEGSYAVSPHRLPFNHRLPTALQSRPFQLYIRMYVATEIFIAFSIQTYAKILSWLH